MNHPKNWNEATNETSSEDFGLWAESKLLLLSAGLAIRLKNLKTSSKRRRQKKKKNKEETAQQLPSSHRGHKKYHLPPIYMSL